MLPAELGETGGGKGPAAIPLPFRGSTAVAGFDPSAPPPACSRWRGGGGAAAVGAPSPSPLEEALELEAGSSMRSSSTGSAAPEPEPEPGASIAAGETWRTRVAIPLTREGEEKKGVQGAGWKKGEGLTAIYLEVLMAVWSLGSSCFANNSTLNQTFVQAAGIHFSFADTAHTEDKNYKKGNQEHATNPRLNGSRVMSHNIGCIRPIQEKRG
jgi:hypothetical protein